MLNLAGLGLEYRPLLTESLAQQAMDIMQKYGASAWLPGSGSNAEWNTTDSLGVSQAPIAGSVGFVADYVKEFAPENLVQNSKFVGASVEASSIPNMRFTLSGGLTPKMVGSGSDSSGPYIDIRVTGTSAGAAFPALFFTNPTYVVTPGDLYTLEVDVAVISNLSAGHSYVVQILGLNGSDGFVEATSPAISPIPGRRSYRATRVLSNAGSVKVGGNIQVNTLAGVPCDVTFRIWRPHLYRGFGAAFVPTSGTEVRRVGYSSLVQETGGFKPVLTSNQLWTFDGVDDRLGSSSPTVSNPTGDCFRVAGWQLPAAAFPNTAIVAGDTIGDPGQARSMLLFGSAGTINVTVIHRDDLGALFFYSSPRTALESVVCSFTRAGDSMEARVRGTVTGLTGLTLVQAMTPWVPKYSSLGAYVISGSYIANFPGPIYGSIQGQGAPTPAEILILENFLAAHAGITLV